MVARFLEVAPTFEDRLAKNAHSFLNTAAHIVLETKHRAGSVWNTSVSGDANAEAYEYVAKMTKWGAGATFILCILFSLAWLAFVQRESTEWLRKTQKLE